MVESEHGFYENECLVDLNSQAAIDQKLAHTVQYLENPDLVFLVN